MVVRGGPVVTGWLTLRELADAAGLAETTARRYARLFGDFLEHADTGRAQRWHPAAVEILRGVHLLYGQGFGTDYVRAHLARLDPIVVDMAPPTATTPPPAATTAELALATAPAALLLQVAEQQATILAEVQAQRAALAEYQTTMQAQLTAVREENAALLGRVERQMTVLGALAQSATQQAQAVQALEQQASATGHHDSATLRGIEQQLAILTIAIGPQRQPPLTATAPVEPRPWWSRWWPWRRRQTE